LKESGLREAETEEHLRAAVEAAVDAGRLLERNSDRAVSVHHKGKIDLVTEMDVKSEKLIVSRLKKLFPTFSFLTEEAEAVDTDSDFRWIIDPLDGTTNYAHGFPIWCVSIALEYRREIVVAVVYVPILDELFTATMHESAKLNGKSIKVTEREQLTDSLLATGFPYDIRTSEENNLDYFSRFAVRAQAIRRAGSAALDLCYLAAGRFDGFWELKLHPWDTAAGILIVEQAGGRVSDFDGGKYSIFDKNLLASNGKIHVQMVDVLRD
jgi:myo-inositol-1(or 4)-monophosphatase